MMNKLKAEIYIHIPFCVKKCDYCDFLSAPSDENTMKQYIEALKKEVSMSKGMLASFTIDTVFLGGGTPSILSADMIAAIIETVRQNADLCDDAEITVECNPGTLTYEKLCTYQKAGVNRLSIGLQSAQDDELKSIGRIHTWQQFVDNYNLARKAGFHNINIDIMSALPGQTIDSYKETLEKITALNPEHISAYSLIVEEGTKMYDRVQEAERNGKSILPDEDVEREMYYLTKRFLENKGYYRYEISNYAKKGFACEHNIGYWKRKNYFGFGIGAASLVEDVRYSNTSDIHHYMRELSSGKSMEEIRVNVTELSNQDKKEEFMFLGLRMMEGISKTTFREQFHQSYDSLYGEITKKLTKQGLLIETEDRVRLTERGIDISNSVLAEFLL